jgi:hypothetical protein
MYELYQIPIGKTIVQITIYSTARAIDGWGIIGDENLSARPRFYSIKTKADLDEAHIGQAQSEGRSSNLTIFLPSQIKSSS